VVAPAHNKHTITSFSQLNITISSAAKTTINFPHKKKKKIKRIYTLTDLGLDSQNPNISDLLSSPLSLPK
jgi:hypothetical protein